MIEAIEAIFIVPPPPPPPLGILIHVGIELEKLLGNMINILLHAFLLEYSIESLFRKSKNNIYGEWE